jgi:hypothetical protein
VSPAPESGLAPPSGASASPASVTPELEPPLELELELEPELELELAPELELELLPLPDPELEPLLPLLLLEVTGGSLELPPLPTFVTCCEHAIAASINIAATVRT